MQVGFKVLLKIAWSEVQQSPSQGITTLFLISPPSSTKEKLLSHTTSAVRVLRQVLEYARFNREEPAQPNTLPATQETAYLPRKKFSRMS